MSARRSPPPKQPAPAAPVAPLAVTRVQTGIRIEKRLLKVMKGIAEYHDMTLGDLLEGICLHVIEGKLPFGRQSIAVAGELKRLYGLDLDASASHRMPEVARPAPARARLAK